MISIDTHYPIPGNTRALRTGRAPKYPWRRMLVGDSFLMRSTPQKHAAALASAATRRTGRKFITRNGRGNSTRVWRVK